MQKNRQNRIKTKSMKTNEERLNREKIELEINN